MKIKDIKLSDLNKIFGEFYKLAGAKEIFKKFNIELINEETELQSINDFVNVIKNLFEKDSKISEFITAHDFLLQDINMKKQMLSVSTGMMSQLLNMQIIQSEQSISMLDGQIKKDFIDKIKEISKENISNENDLAEIEKILKEKEFVSLSKLETYELILTNIKNRYSNNKVENTNEEVKELVKEEPKETKEKSKASDVLDKIDEENLIEDIVEEKKETNENTLKFQETKEEKVLNKSDVSKEEKEVKKEETELSFEEFFNEETDEKIDDKKEETKETKEIKESEKEEDPFLGFNDSDFDEFKKNDTDELGFNFNNSNEELFF